MERSDGRKPRRAAGPDVCARSRSESDPTASVARRDTAKRPSPRAGEPEPNRGTQISISRQIVNAPLGQKGRTIMTISEKVAYLKGLAEGLNLDTEKSKEGKLISVMIGILEEVGLSIEDLEENAHALGEEIDALSDDLADVESVVYDEEDDGEEDYDDDWFEVECPNCEEPLIIDDEALAEGVVQCPNCKTKFSLDLSDDSDGEEEDSDQE